jgi:hypothetical protein
MDELEARAGALLRTGARDQQAWLEAWTRSPIVWARLPALLSSPAPSPAARPFLCAAAVASCAAPGVSGEWCVAVARAVLALSPSHAVRCDAATVLEAAVAARNPSWLAPCWQRPRALQPRLRVATDALLDAGSGEERGWAQLCLAAGGPSTAVQWRRCFALGLGECLCEAASRVDPDWLAQELPRAPAVLLPVAELAGRASDALLAAVVACAARGELEQSGVRALGHLVALRDDEGPTLVPLLAPLVGRLLAAADGGRVMRLCASPPEEEEEEEEDDAIGKSSYDAALARLTRTVRAPATAYDMRCARLASIVGLAALRDPELRRWTAVRLAALPPPAALPDLLDASLLLRLAAACAVDDGGTERAAALQLHLLSADEAAKKGPAGAGLCRALCQLYAFALSLLESWEERSVLPPPAVLFVGRALSSPHPCRFSAAAAADFAASAILRLRLLLPPLGTGPPPGAPPRLLAAWLAHALLRPPVALPQVTLTWSYAAVAAHCLGAELLPLLLPLLRLEPDGNLDAALVLRVCGIRVPLDSSMPLTEAAAARLVEVTGQSEPALSRFPDSTLVLGAVLSSVHPVPIQLLAQAVCCNDLTVQASAVSLMLKRCPVPRELGVSLSAALLRQVHTPHAAQAIKLLHKINVSANWAFISTLGSPAGLVLSPDLVKFQESISGQ